MRRIVAIGAVVALHLTTNGTMAAGEAAAKYQPCIACHGAQAQGNVALGAPALAGQDGAYLQRQLEHFQAGRRGTHADDAPGAQMKAMAATLTEADIALLSAYLAVLPGVAVKAAAGGDLRNGNNYYQSACGACHGGKAQGNPGMNAPALAILDADYLKRQFGNFQRGLRGTDPTDTYGRQMKMMSTTLPAEKDLDDVIAFIHSLSKQ